MAEKLVYIALSCDASSSITFIGACATLDGAKGLCQLDHEKHGQVDRLDWMEYLHSGHPEFHADGCTPVGLYEIHGIPYTGVQ